MITPDMLTWRPYTIVDDDPRVLGYIECTARTPDGLVRKATYCISKEYVSMPRAHDYFWYIVATMTKSMCEEYYKTRRQGAYLSWIAKQSRYAGTGTWE